MAIRFEIQKVDPSGARLGRLTTPHGTIETPAFMPVGTAGTVKAMTQGGLEELHVNLLLANPYHLYLRPGHELIRRMGGLHRFMAWRAAILTDSGGFQVFSLADLRKVNDEGVHFRSHLDGSEHILTPKKAIEANSAGEANPEQAFFAIVQGGMHKDLRRESTAELVALDFPGYAIGGLAVGEPHDISCEIAHLTAVCLPPEKPRYVMGVGKPEQLVDYVRCGADMMDCVLPTRNARNGYLYTSEGPLHIKNAEFKDDPPPLDEACACMV